LRGGGGGGPDRHASVVEVMYPDFTMYAADSIANQAAKYRYMCGGGPFKVPVVFRIAGSGSSNGPVAITGSPWRPPSSIFPVESGLPFDALRRQGIDQDGDSDDNPVLFYEHKLLYGIKGRFRKKSIPFPSERRKSSGKGRM